MTVLLEDALIGSQGEDAIHRLSRPQITKIRVMSNSLLWLLPVEAVLVARVASLFVNTVSQKEKRADCLKSGTVSWHHVITFYIEHRHIRSMQLSY